MRQTFTLSFKNFLTPLLLQLVLVLCVVVQGYGQDRVTVFAESMGTVSSTTVDVHETNNRFDNDNQTMSGPGAVNNLVVSSGYTGASGGNSVIVGSTTGFFQIAGINTENFESLQLNFGVRKNSTSATGSDLALEFSTDNGGNWQTLTFSPLAPGTGWERKQANETIPSVPNLSIRFRKISGIVQYRIDDVELTGTPVVSIAPEITSFSPTSGGIGTRITIVGNNLQDVTEAFFLEDGSALNVVSVSATEVVADVVEGYFSESQLYLLTSNGEDATSEGYFTFITPTITSFSPEAGPVGTQVTIIGENLLSTYEARFGGGIVVVPDFASDTEVRVTVPEGAQTGGIELFTEIGNVSTPTNFTVYRPEISSISPTSAKVGATVTITGTRLNIGGTPTVTFEGGAVATITSESETELKVTVPAGAQTGSITVTSTEGSGTSPTFTLIVPTITITADLTTFNSVAGFPSEEQTYTVSASNLGSSITITAPSNFQIFRPSTNSWHQTRTLGVNAQGNLSATTVTIRYLPAAAGTHSGIITHVATDASADLAVNGVAEAALSVTDVSPNTSRIQQEIVITGTRLNAGTTGTLVTFNNVIEGEPRVQGENITIVSATELRVTVPTNAASGSIVVSTSENTVTWEGFTVLRPDIVLTGTLAPFETSAGVASDPQQYTISAVNLIESTLIAAPANFQISLTENDGYVSLLEVPLTNTTDGSIAETTIFVRYLPAEEGIDSGSIVHTSEGESESLAVSGTAAEPLPVELVSFTAEQKGAATLLKWVTASETDNSHFEVEMSTSPEAGFTKIGTVKSKVVNSSVTTRYDYTHQVRNAGTYYYRLKQVDLDGTYAYSNVIVVESRGVGANAVTVAPNPLIPDSKIIVEAASSGKAIMRLTSMTGQQVYFREVEVTAGPNEFALPYYDKLQNTAYILTVELNGKVITTKVVKQ